MLWSVWASDLYGNWHVVSSELGLQEALESRGRGLVVPDRYVNRLVDVLSASRLAEQVLEEATGQHDQSLVFEQTVCRLATPMYWTFSRICKQWRESGYLPGTISCQIDTHDGSVWPIEEQEQVLLFQR